MNSPNQIFLLVFELDLKAGHYDLQTWLGSGKNSVGALFVYVSSR